MKLTPMGDYYLWYCEWCDSRNLTLWTKVTKSQVCCTACHKNFTAHDLGCRSKGAEAGQHAVPPAC